MARDGLSAPSGGPEGADATLLLPPGLALCRDRQATVEGLAVGEEFAVDCGRGAGVQGVALAASYGQAADEGDQDE